MKLSKDMLLLLRKCDAAERFTTVPGRLTNAATVVKRGQACGLVEWRNGWRLTEAGRVVLEKNR